MDKVFKTIFIFLFFLIFVFSCEKDSKSITNNDEPFNPYKFPLTNEQKAYILGDMLGNLNGLQEEAEINNLDSIFVENNEAYFLGAMDIELTRRKVITNADLWYYMRRIYGPFYGCDSVTFVKPESVPEYLVYSIYLIAKEPEFNIIKFYHSFRDSLQSGNWHEYEIVEAYYD